MTTTSRTINAVPTPSSTINGVPTARDTATDSVALATQTTYKIDPTASRVEFSIGKRLFFVKKLTVTGHFADVAGMITLDEQDPTRAWAEATIGAASIDTGNGRRDKHLRGTDFFDADGHPTLTFRSRCVEPIDGAAARYRVVGDLTVRGITREVTLETHDAPAPGTGHDHRVTLTLTGALNRQDFGIVWSKPVLKIADDLTVTLTLEATRV